MSEEQEVKTPVILTGFYARMSEGGVVIQTNSGRFKPKSDRIPLLPYYTREELEHGVAFRMIGEGKEKQGKYDSIYFRVNDLDTGLERILYGSYELLNTIDGDKDTGKTFMVKIRGTSTTATGRTVLKFAVCEIEPVSGEATERIMPETAKVTREAGEDGSKEDLPF
jgi:hypothetical protein